MRWKTALLEDFQRDLPLVARPFAAIGKRLGVCESEVIAELQALRERGAVNRVGAVFSPRRLGASTLAALEVPVERMAAVAAMVTDYPEVNHNYEREHRFNLWFVATCESEQRLETLLDDIRARSGCRLLKLPLLEEFHIDLAFSLNGKQAKTVSGITPHPKQRPACVEELSAAGRALIATLQPGLPLVPQPFAHIASAVGSSEAEVLAQIEKWLAAGAIKRMGVVVRHHELGYTANAMVVWDVPDADVSELGHRLATEPAVTLCYRRPRELPDWPYNLFCMIHGKARAEVEAEIARIAERQHLQAIPRAVLFSTVRHKQTGARYFAESALAHG